MKPKLTLIIVLALVVIGGLWYIWTEPKSAPATPAADTGTAASPQPPQLDSVTPLATTTSSVDGVDLSAFTDQANQSAAWSSADGSGDADAFSSDASTTNSSMDADGGTVQ